jgi:hypothetical protein
VTDFVRGGANMTTFSAYQLIEIALADPNNIVGVPHPTNESDYWVSDSSKPIL